MTDSLQKLALSCTFALRKGTLEQIEEDTESPSTVSGLEAGAVLDSKYKIIDQIGQGGMGAVYKVHHLLLQKDMALKTFRSHSLSPESWQRFQREARAIAKLKHKNIVEVFDFGIVQAKVPYYTMELLRGESLADRLARKGKMEVNKALHIFLQAAEALAYAHRQQIVHRDIKPANIFLQKEQEARGVVFHVKIVDFGIAKLAEESSSLEEQSLTQSGAVFGSPLYMSPEQSLGMTVDLRTDIYSFGCALFESLAGHPPFVGDTAMITLLQHQTKSPPRLKDILEGAIVPQRLESLVAKLLAKEPEKRPQTFEEVISELNYCIQELGATRSTKLPEAADWEAEDEGEPEAVQQTPTSRKLQKMVIGAIAAGLAIACFFLLPHKVHSDAKLTNPATSGQSSAYSTWEKFPAVERKIDVHQKDREKACQDKTPFLKDIRDGLRIFQFPSYAEMGCFIYEAGNRSQVCQGPQELKIPTKRQLHFLATGEPFLRPELLERFGPNDLHGLHLEGNEVYGWEWTSSQLKHITKLKSLKDLNISHNLKINASAVQYIDQLPKLEALDVSMSGVDGGVLTSLKILPKLSSLVANETKAVPVLFRFMARHPDKFVLKRLSVARNQIKDDDLEEIGKLTSLEDLNLNQNLIHGAGLNSLTSLHRLTNLQLEKNELDSSALEALAKLKSLRRLVIGPGKYSEQDVERLRHQLPQCIIQDNRDRN